MAEKLTGTVKFFNASKGFGFIAVEGGKDYFVHISAIERAGLKTLDKDQKVKFSAETDRRGKEAAVDIEIA